MYEIHFVERSRGVITFDTKEDYNEWVDDGQECSNAEYVSCEQTFGKLKYIGEAVTNV